MDKAVSDHLRLEEHLGSIGAALRTGLILLDSKREIAWIDEHTCARLNGGTEQLAATLRAADTHVGVHCCLCVREVVVNGETAMLCVIQERDPPQDEHGFDPIAAIEAAMADTSWFTRTIIEKFRALRQANPPAPRTSELDILSDREREVLGLICEGRSDAQMGEMLNLSQNTIRNHIASLYRKIGVNRRSAAVIWARERGFTSQDACR